MDGKKKLYRRDQWSDARQEWVGKWVWFAPEDGTGIQAGLVSMINGFGEIIVSYDFDERGCFTLPACTVDEAQEVLRLLSADELVVLRNGKPLK